jgi:hypothetical protein
MRTIGFTVLLFAFFAATANGDTIAVWNFNDAISGTTGGELEFLVDRGSGTMTSDFVPSNIGNASGSVINSSDGDPAGRALRLSSSANNGNSLIWNISTEGFDTIGVTFAIQTTSTGFSNNQFFYSVNSGVSWISFGDSVNSDTSFSLQSFDLSGIPQLSDNPDTGFRILFDAASSSSGNSKIDNLVVSGNPLLPPAATPVPESSTIALTTAGLAGVFLVRKYKSNRRSNRYREQKFFEIRKS